MDSWLNTSGFKDLVNAGVGAAQGAASQVREFDRNVRGTITTKELLEQIEQQEQELFTYKKRTRDLVTRFKTLVEEKQKLEETVQALSSAPKEDDDDENNEDAQEVKEKIKKKVRKLKKIGMKKVVKSAVKNENAQKTDDGENNGDGWDNESDVEIPNSEEVASEYESEYESYYTEESDDEENDNQPAKTQSPTKTVDTGQIKILTRQLAEALQQNNKQNETFKTDRKIMKAEYEQKIDKINQELASTKEELDLTNNQLASIKDQLRDSGANFQKEKDHADKHRREAQHQIFKYRQKIENLEIQLDREKDARGRAEFDAEKEKADGMANNTLLSKYQTEVSELKSRLVVAEEKLSQPDTTNLTKIKQLQEELEFKTKEHSKQTEIWTNQRTEQDNRIKNIQKSEENRRSVLEQQINELSASIGLVEKQKLKDTEIISDLKNRISQQDLEILELENKSKSSQDMKFEELPRFMADVVKRTHGENQVFSGMLIACRKGVSEEVSIASLMQIFPEVKTAFDKEICRLKDEVSSLQRELADSSKNDSFKESSISSPSPKTPQKPINSKQEEQLKAHVLQLQTQLSDLKSHISSLELKQKNKESELQHNFDSKIKENDQTWQTKLHELEIELINQRERSLKTLNDKEREVQQLRAAFNSPPNSPEKQHQNTDISEENNSNSVFSGHDELENKIENQSGLSIMHYSEKLARKDIELDTLKKQNKECVKRIRQLQEKIMREEENHESIVQEFKDRIAVAINPVRKEREKETNNHNDYIKNVLFNFLIMPRNATGRVQTLQALAASLGFTNEELNKVRSVQKL